MGENSITDMIVIGHKIPLPKTVCWLEKENIDFQCRNDCHFSQALTSILGETSLQCQEAHNIILGLSLKKKCITSILS